MLIVYLSHPVSKEDTHTHTHTVPLAVSCCSHVVYCIIQTPLQRIPPLKLNLSLCASCLLKHNLTFKSRKQ